MSSASTAYSVPGLGSIRVEARDGVVTVTRSIAGHLIQEVKVTFSPEGAPAIDLFDGLVDDAKSRRLSG